MLDLQWVTMLTSVLLAFEPAVDKDTLPQEHDGCEIKDTIINLPHASPGTH